LNSEAVPSAPVDNKSTSAVTENIREIFKDHPAVIDNPGLIEEIAEAVRSEPVECLEECPSINTSIGKRMEQRIMMLGGEPNFFIMDPRTYRTVPKKAEIAQFIHAHLHTVAFNDTIYTYDTSHGIYIPGQGVIDAAINELCRICGHLDYITSLQNFVVTHLKGMNVFNQYPFDQVPNRIPFSNGTVRLNGTTWILEDVRPSDMVTWRLNFPYDPFAPTAPVEKVLSDWVGEDDAHLLTQIPAQALLQMTQSQPYKMNYLLLGPPDAGKSTYIDLLQTAFGQNRCAEVPLQQIGMRFKNAELEGKLINLFDDLSDQEFTNLGAFKKLTGRFQHPIERKGKDTYEGLIKCVHVFSCNKPPTLNITDDDAFYSRWQPVIFPNHFNRDPDWFTKTVTPEFLSGFANLVLNQYVSISENKLASDRTAEDVKEFWMRESMPEYAFTMDCLETGVDYTIPVAECYDLYVKWMTEKGYPASKTKNLVHFGRAMNKSQLIKTGQETVSTKDGKSRIYVYKGVQKKIKESHP